MSNPHPLSVPRLQFEVRETFCKDHPGSPWLNVKVDGNLVMSCCIKALECICYTMLGKDLLSGAPVVEMTSDRCQEMMSGLTTPMTTERVRERQTAPPDAPSSPSDFELPKEHPFPCYHLDAYRCKCKGWSYGQPSPLPKHHRSCPFYGWVNCALLSDTEEMLLTRLHEVENRVSNLEGDRVEY